ncbi:MAG: SDR family oxidoreductase [Gemmatimonadaceae bacterium]|nr:SDR family oxidoreductase [Gemmatimonadaceae bacterium]
MKSDRLVNGRLADKVAIVTGAASGIGRAIAITFASHGARVVLADVREDPREGGAPTADVIAEAGGDATFHTTDVSVWSEVDRLVKCAVERFGSLDVMVNNAAISTNQELIETEEEDWDRVMAINLKGVFFGCKRAIQQMLTQDAVDDVRGRIVNVSSQHGMVSSPTNFAYGTSKAGVVYMTRQIASDYAKRNIVCNAVAPGKIETGKPGPAASEASLRYSHDRTPMPRLGRPQDVANAALFLASDEATYITGENLMVDGGWMAN